MEMLRLSKRLRYRIIDTSCPSPLFHAEDISLQQVAMDPVGKKNKAWVAVVKLNTKDQRGYLQSELRRCKSEKKFLVGTTLTVKAYDDENDCCQGIVDYEKCNGCKGELKKLKSVQQGKHYSKDILVTGSYFHVENSITRRRRLLSDGDDGPC